MCSVIGYHHHDCFEIAKNCAIAVFMRYEKPPAGFFYPLSGAWNFTTEWYRLKHTCQFPEGNLDTCWRMLVFKDDHDKCLPRNPGSPSWLATLPKIYKVSDKYKKPNVFLHCGRAVPIQASILWMNNWPCDSNMNWLWSSNTQKHSKNTQKTVWSIRTAFSKVHQRKVSSPGPLLASCTGISPFTTSSRRQFCSKKTKSRLEGGHSSILKPGEILILNVAV